ncbi:hypothetical protein RV10_GL003006 [Enterococcus pallens]|nr:hypothetical protein RV10_GL003006 [Enterococcus pallens]
MKNLHLRSEFFAFGTTKSGYLKRFSDTAEISCFWIDKGSVFPEIHFFHSITILGHTGKCSCHF